MAEKTNEQQKRGRLGRGLGSLLGGAATQQSQSTKNIEEPNSPAAEGGSLDEKEVHSVSTSTAIALKQDSKISSSMPGGGIPPEARIWKIAVEKLHPNEYQPRQKFNKDSLKDLANSIKDKGILQPIVARKHASGALEIISGERRWRAAQLAGLQEVPVIIRTVNDQDSLELAIIENIQREDLNPIDEAEAYQRLAQEFKLTQQQIAEKVGKERATVANSLRLLLLSDQVREMLVNQQISVGHCKVLLSLENPKTQTDLAKKASTEQLSVRALEKLVGKVLKGESPDEPSAPDEKALLKKTLVLNLADELQKIIGTKVGIEYSDGKGRLVFAFYSDDELNHLTEKFKSAWLK